MCKPHGDAAGEAEDSLLWNPCLRDRDVQPNAIPAYCSVRSTASIITRDIRTFADAREVNSLRGALETKVSWTDFEQGLRRIDEMRVFLETVRGNWKGIKEPTKATLDRSRWPGSE